MYHCTLPHLRAPVGCNLCCTLVQAPQGYHSTRLWSRVPDLGLRPSCPHGRGATARQRHSQRHRCSLPPVPIGFFLVASLCTVCLSASVQGGAFPASITKGLLKPAQVHPRLYKRRAAEVACWLRLGLLAPSQA